VNNEEKSSAFYTYLVRYNDGSIYVGSTDNLLHQLLDQDSGSIDSRTSSTSPARLVYAEAHSTSDAAIRRKLTMKGWSRNRREAFLQSL